MKPLIMLIDVTTGDITNREMTDDEYAVYLSDQEQAEAEAINE